MVSKFFISFFLFIGAIYFFLPFVYANDREKPDYLYYEAIVKTKTDKPWKTIFRLDMDYTYLLITIPKNSATSVSLKGDSTIPLPAKPLNEYKINLNKEQAADFVDGAYYLSVVSEGKETKTPILISSDASPLPLLNPLDLNRDKSVDKSDWNLFADDISNYFSLIFDTNKKNADSMTMNKKEHTQMSSIKNKPTLLSRYTVYKQIPDYNVVMYRPRQFASGLKITTKKTNYLVTSQGHFKGWDIFIPPDDETSRKLVTTQWLKFTLNRPAQIALVWIGPKSNPEWLKKWKTDSTIEIDKLSHTVFTKKYPAGEVVLGSGSYFVLFAEENGKPSTEPAVAKNFEIPQPNKVCPKWVHEQYTVTETNGKTYATWHPQIDPVFWCYFGHEHGADPSQFDKNLKLPFGYAGEAMGMYEAHPGFKTYIWDDKYGYRWLALQHMGSSTNQAACGRYHELDFMVKKKDSDKILAKRFFVGDYGVSYSIVTGKPLTPTDCPDQKSIKSRGLRFLPISGEREDTQEPWVVASNKVVGFNFADFSVTTKDSVRVCKDITCNSIILTGNTGTSRSISYVDGLSVWSGLGYSGTFYTDPTGEKIVKKNDPEAVEQYVASWTTVYSELPQSKHYFNSTDCYDLYGFGAVSVCGIDLVAAPAARENAVTLPN